MKNRRKFLGKAATILGLSTLPFAAQSRQKKTSNFYHVVFFWLKDNSETNKRDFVKVTSDFVKQVEEVDRFNVGLPAETYRDVVDRSYSVALIVEFHSKREHDIYQEHPVHKDYIENNSHRWSRVQVYDMDKSI